MKKTMLVVAMVLLVAAFATSQTYTLGSGLTGIDKLGAHQNGGKGCVGCHAPHSGWAGNGGNAQTGQGQDKINAGNYALWGQDLGPLYGATLNQGDNVQGGSQYQTVLPAQSDFYNMPEEITGIMMCLSCHDGNIAEGAMMTNWSYEQHYNLLPANLYGSYHIPTLLGADGVTAAGNYYNDHPVGPQATLGAVNVASNFTFQTCTWHGQTAPCLKPDPADPNKYVEFAAHYGSPSITSNGHASPVALPSQTDPKQAYLLCTTCHTPHSMYVASANSDAPIHTLTKGNFPAYFFIAAPYNPGSNPGPTQASSATQFCRQCHFSGAGGANESSGIMGVDTAF